MDKKSFKKMAYSYAAYGGASVFGPMLVLGVAGYALDKFFGTKFIVFIGIGAAFLITNFLIYKKTKKLSEMMAEEKNKNKEE